MTSEGDNGYEWDDSDGYVSEYDLEVELEGGSPDASDEFREDFDELEAYADEPLADEKWLEAYEADKRVEEELKKTLEERLNGTKQISEWCSCGNCKRELLQNISECYCCRELDGCVETFTSDLVVQELSTGEEITCITGHPGFNPVCLQKWSLRLAADKYRTKENRKYGQTGSENSFLRSVSYREFSRLVYGYLGNKRIPMPACAYTAIRETFPGGKDENYTGFDLDEEES